MANLVRVMANTSARCAWRSLALAPRPVTNATISKFIAPTSLVAKRFSSSHDNHSKTWTVERILSGGLLVMTPAAFALSLPAVDYLLAAALVLHVHWGLEAIVVDYVRPSIFGPVVPRLALGLLYLLSALSLGGLCYFNYTDVGIVQGLQMAWKRL